MLIQTAGYALFMGIKGGKMTNYKKITDLPIYEGLPEEDELVVPVFLDRTNHAFKSISVRVLIEYIKIEVQKGVDVEIIITEQGIRFKKVEGKM